MIRALAVLVLITGCSHGGNPNGAHYLKLPDPLSEISGLAAASPNSVFAHDDERGIIHEVSLDDGRIIRSFAIGNPVLSGDFEGIAADGERLWLIDSEGVIHAFNAGPDRTRVRQVEYDTGVGEYCEIEGLSLAPDPDKLMIVCKNMLRGERRGTLVIFEWDARTHDPVGQPWREIDLGEALGQERTQFAPSGIEWLPEFRQILVISARGRSLLILDENGRVLVRHRLNADRHPQPEGITVVGSNRLVIADEGQLHGPGQIAIYLFPLGQARAH